MQTKTIEEKILKLIPSDENNPVTLRELCRATGLSRATVAKIVQDLRKENPICSNVEPPYGYFLGDEKAVLRTIGRIDSQAYQLMQTADNLRVCIGKSTVGKRG